MKTDFDTFLAKVANAPLVAPVSSFKGTGRFEIRARLGGGSFGDVYEARDREYGSTVALKLLRLSSPDFLYRFMREFRTVVDIFHPNLVRLYELLQEDKHWFLTMELVDGLVFDEHLKRAPEQLQSCFAQLASAIESLHREGVLHRDIKPANILVEHTGRVVLLDFGLAREGLSPLTSAIAGTPHYMAPEQLEGNPSPQSDWFAFGVMLYEALSGRSPFSGTDLMARRMAPLKCAVPPGIDARLADLATRLVSPDASARPSAEEIASVLRVERVERDFQSDIAGFVGRTSELEALDRALEHSALRPTVISILGAPGIGKTTLARTFLEIVRGCGARIYEGRCHEAETLPFKGLDGLVDMLCEDLRTREAIDVASIRPRDTHALTQMFPVLKRVSLFASARPPRGQSRSPHELRAAAFAALRELLMRLADSAPLVLFVDDMQWAEQDSVNLLLALLRAPAPQMLVVLTARQEKSGPSGPMQEFIEEVGKIEGVHHQQIELDGLDQASIEELIAKQTGPVLDAHRLWQESGGHPFLLSRLLQGGQEAQSRDIREVLAADFEKLEDQARRVLLFVSISAVPLTQLDACRLAGLREWRGPLFDALRQSRLVRTLGVDPGSIVEPYHDRVRETLLATQSDTDNRSLHATLAEYLRQSSRAPAHAIAHHYAACGDREPAFLWAYRAATQAKATMAFSRAASLYQQATSFCDDDELSITLHEEWGQAVALAGRSVEAGRIFLAGSEVAARIGDSDEFVLLLARAGEHLMLGGDLVQGTAVILRALAERQVELPTDRYTTIAKAFNLGAALAVRGLDYTPQQHDRIDQTLARLVDVEVGAARALGFTDLRAPYLGALGLTHALELGDSKRVQRALCFFVMTNAGRAPDHELFADAIHRAFALAEQSNDEEELGRAHTVRGLTRRHDGDLLRGLPDLKMAEEIFWRIDPPMVREASSLRITILLSCIWDGVDVPFALEHCESWMAEAASRDDVYAGNWLRLLSSWVMLARNDSETATARVDQAEAIWAEVADDIFWASVCIFRIGVALYRAPEEAFGLVDCIEPEFNKRYVSMVPVSRSSFHALRGHAAAAAFAHNRASAELTIERIEASISMLAMANYWAPAIDGLRAHICAIRGEKQGAARHLQSAANRWAERSQVAFSHCAALRQAQIVGDGPGADAQRGSLRALGIVDPDRYATLFAGPAYSQ